ncbi:hypothetical protein PhaeoP14_03819 (plasmid) [Phaeobacter piscinae]|nr:hypothetical protein PhaeoP14_03819 [Phaeobacter piscinae]
MTWRRARAGAGSKEMSPLDGGFSGWSDQVSRGDYRGIQAPPSAEEVCAAEMNHIPSSPA